MTLQVSPEAPTWAQQFANDLNKILLKITNRATAPFRLPTYAKASLPSASSYAFCQIYVTDDTGGAVVAFSDGTNWRRVTDRNVIS